MNYRQLGTTGLSVSVIGFGGVPINRVSTQRALRTLHRAFDLGINFVDSARSYGDSEEKIGAALRQYGAGREDIIIVTKSRARDFRGMADDIETSLRALRTEHIHLYQIHDPDREDLERALAPGGAVEALTAARDAGKIGHIGVSGHRPRVLIPAMETGLFETVQLPLNIIDYPLFRENIPAAVRRNLGIIVMKPLCGGLLESPPRALRFVLSHPVSTVIPGMDSPAQVEENAESGREEVDLSEVDMARLQAEAEELGREFCRRCGYCGICPAGLKIPEILRFDRYYTSYFSKDWAQEQYRALEVTVDGCLDCGECEQICPYQLPIRRMLREAHTRLSGGDG
ncbi:MAG: aldo/keto reductase [Bacillota bacterium]